MFLRINRDYPIQKIYQERIRVQKILNGNKLKINDNNKIIFRHINNSKLKCKCNYFELKNYLDYLDKQLYIFPKLVELPELLINKIK
jgi:hypothetical protein